MPNVNIITGAKHKGKTTYLLNKILELTNSGKSVAGIVSKGNFMDSKRHNFYALNIDNNEQRLLLSVDKILDSDKIGKFFISKETFEWGAEILRNAILSNTEVLVLDELGKFELEGNGWANVFSEMLDSNKELYLVFREEYVSDLIAKFSITDYQVVKL